MFTQCVSNPPERQAQLVTGRRLSPAARRRSPPAGAVLLAAATDSDADSRLAGRRSRDLPSWRGAGAGISSRPPRGAHPADRTDGGRGGGEEKRPRSAHTQRPIGNVSREWID